MEIGTKVFVNELPKNSHPHSTGSEHELINCYGTVTGYVGDGYYTITAEDDMTSGIFRRYNLIYFGSNWPSYRVGEVVRVCGMSEEEKRNYRTGWNRQMEKYIGQTLRITEHRGRHNTYNLEGNDWIWDASNLEPVSEFVGF